jgi:rod shape-determining protein MreC
VRDTRRTRVVLFVLLVAALALIAFNYSDGNNSALRAVRNAGGDIFGGAENAASSVAGFFGGGSSSTQVKGLQEQVDKLRAELSAARLSQSDYSQLRKMLLVAGAAQYKVVAASVVAVGTGYQQTVTLDAGSNAGIKPDETVLNGQGLVGEVTSVTGDTSTVLLASDPSEVVGVALAPTGQLGWVSGPGKTAGSTGEMKLQMLSSAAVLKPGDQLVTSASVNDRPFVPGVPVGEITRLVVQNGALTESAMVRPYVDFTALGVVGVVIAKPAQNPRFAALPPLPHPGPTVTVTVTPRASRTPVPGSQGGTPGTGG